MKSKRKYNNHSRQIKKVTGTPIIIGRKVEPVVDRRGQDKMGKLTKMSDACMEEMARDKAAGMTDKTLSEKYGVHTSYVRDSLQRFYLSSRKGKEILKGIFLEGAIAAGMHAATKVKDLTGMQAAGVAKVFTDSLVTLEKHDANRSAEVDLNALDEMSEALKDIRAELTEGGHEDTVEGDSVLS